MVLKATLPFVVLMFEASLGGSKMRSCMVTLVDDLRWLAVCDPLATYSLAEWVLFARTNPSAARHLVRKVCDGEAARRVSLSELGGKANIASIYTCFCGTSFPSKAALDGHRVKFHKLDNPANFFAAVSNMCECCRVQFSNRHLLMTHLTRGAHTCLLHHISWGIMISNDQLIDIRRQERILTADREKAGLPQRLAVIPAHRISGPIPRMYSLDGSLVPDTSNLHPFGPQKRKYRTDDYFDFD